MKETILLREIEGDLSTGVRPQMSHLLIVRLQEGRRLCTKILQEDPVNAQAQEVLGRLHALLNQVGNWNSRFDQTSALLHQWRQGELDAVTPEEKGLDALIEQWENAFLAFGKETMEPRIEAMPRETHAQRKLRDALLAPYALVDYNRKNSLKNSDVMTRISQQRGNGDGGLLLTQPDPMHFSYGRLPKHLQQVNAQGAFTIAGFSLVGRTVYLAEEIDVHSPMEMLAMAHEIGHSIQQIPWREDVQFYANFYGGHTPSRMVLDHEYEQYGLQLEGMNLLLGNKMRLAAERGEQCDPQMVTEALKGNRFPIQTIERMCILARGYFPGGNAGIHQFPELFRKQIQFIHKDIVQEMYEKQAGELVRVY